MGRPTKIEGNPEHPASLGATDMLRRRRRSSASTIPIARRPSPIAARSGPGARFTPRCRRRSATRRRTQGAGLRILTEPITSPSLAEQISPRSCRLSRKRKWHQWDPVALDGAAQGRARRPAPSDADLSLRQGRRHRLARLRFPRLRRRQRALHARLRRRAGGVGDGRERSMNRLYVVESTPTLTGAKADHRLPVRARRSTVRAAAAALSAPRRRARCPDADARRRRREVDRARSPRICRRTAAARSSSPASTSPRRCTRSRTR